MKLRARSLSLSVVLLWCLQIVVYADTPSINPFVNSTNLDVSKYYLGKIFGTIPGVLYGSGSSMMGHLFYVFNQGVMVIAAVWLMYSIFNVIVTHATTGMQAQSKHQVVLTSLRVVFGLAMLLPSATTGYCAIQDLMMKVVLEGVNLADMTWHYALQYLDNGGTLFIPKGSPSNTLSLSDVSPRYMAVSNPNGMVQHIFNNEVCMYISNLYNQQNPALNSITKAGITHPYQMTFVPPTEMNGKLIPGSGAIYFPGYNDVYPYKPAVSSGLPYAQACGSVTIPKNMPAGSKLAQFSQAYSALSQMVSDIQPLARKQAQMVMSGGSGGGVEATTGGMYLAQAVMDYLKLLEPVASFDQAQKVKYSHNYIAQAEAEGWLNAGTYFWNMTRANDLMQSSPNASFLVPSVTDQAIKNNPTILHKINEANNSLGEGFGKNPLSRLLPPKGIWQNGLHQLIQMLSAQSNPDAGAINPDQDWQQAIQNEQARYSYCVNPKNEMDHPVHYEHVCEVDTGNGSSSWVGASPFGGAKPGGVSYYYFDLGNADPNGILANTGGHLLGEFIHLESSSSNTGFYDPMVFAQKIGRSSLGSAGKVWSQTADWVKDSESSGGWMSAIPIVGKYLASADTLRVEASLPVLVAVSGAMFTAGFMLAFYAPMYPCLLFLFGGMSWLISVIEAMVAAPLVCFGMTHPDGQDFTGKAEQALMLALSILLRPVLMVIGFVAGTILSYVGFSMINHVFGRVIDSIFPSISAYGGGVVGTAEAMAQTAVHGHNAHMYQSSVTNVIPLEGITSVVNGSPTIFNNQDSGFSTNGFANYIVFILLIVFYGLIAMEIVNQAFSAIHLIPDMVLRWIGGPVQQDQSERLAGQVKSGIQGAAQQAGKLGGEQQINQGKAQGQIQGQLGAAVTGTAFQVAGVGAQTGMQQANSGGAGAAPEEE